MPWLFCYGSNHPEQLAERLGSTHFKMMQARLPDYWRVFRGYSMRWDGGVASIERQPGYSVYGYVAEVTKADLERMDRFEGVGSGKYKRLGVAVMTPDGKKMAVAYVSTSEQFNKPTRAYLEAVAKTIASFWTSESGEAVTWKQIPVR